LIRRQSIGRRNVRAHGFDPPAARDMTRSGDTEDVIMTNDVPNAGTRNFPVEDARLSAAESAGALDDDVAVNDDPAADEERLSKLPPEERDDDRTVGGGMLAQGGTSISRGTGTLGGEAQGRDVEADEANRGRADMDDEVAFPTEPGGGTH
jgi:hypothetical protein